MDSSSSKAEYEDYLSVSKKYDNLRVPVGLDSLNAALEVAAKGVGLPRASLKLLDVGCGTGNYIAAIKDKVVSCTGLEFNAGMLEHSRTKHKGDDRVRLIQGSAVDMGCFEDETFDIVIMTQVLHHLDMDMQNKALANIQRVLKKGGVFWISTCTPEQCLNGIWYGALVPQACSVIASNLPGLPLLKYQISKSGLKVASVDLPKDTFFPSDKYLDVNGPFSELYRKCDSTWSLATPNELEAGLAWWKEQVDAGLAEQFLKDREEIRATVGQSLAVTCVKA